jgi:NADH-quinone oxidoreductase subunit N
MGNAYIGSIDSNLWMPEMALIVMTLLILVFGIIFAVPGDSRIVFKTYIFSLVAICVYFIIVFGTLEHYHTDSEQHSLVARNGGNSSVELYIPAISFIVISSTYSYNKSIGILSSEYYIIMLFRISGFCIFVNASNLILMYITIELQSICSYILTSMHKRNRYSIEAGSKHFIPGSFSSIILLFGSTSVYGFSGSVDVYDIGVYVHYLYATNTDFLLSIFFNIGSLFKIYCAPFHSRVADIYQGAPSSVTMFLSTVPVVAYTYVFVKLYVLIFSDFFGYFNEMLYVLSVSSMLLGLVGALAQKKIKRLIAYSPVSMIGYVLAGLSSNNILVLSQCFPYVFVYTITVIPIFIIILNYRSANSARVTYLDSIHSFAALYTKNRLLFFTPSSFFLSMAGIPPFAGFYSKFLLFPSLVSEKSYIPSSISIFTTLVGAYYHIRVIKIMFYDVENDAFPVSSISYYPLILISFFLLFNVSFVFVSDVFEDICFHTSPNVVS